MFRSLTIGVLTGSLLLAAGCDQSQPPATNLGSAPPAQGVPPVTPPQPGQAAPTPSVPPTPPTPADPTGPTSITLEVAFAGTERSARRLGELFDSIQDDASAMAAAAHIPAASQDLAAGMKQFNRTLAALSLAGQDDQIKAFFEQQAAREDAPYTNLMTKVKRVRDSPQYPLVRNEINSLLDAMLGAGTTGEKRALQRLIERDKLRG